MELAQLKGFGNYLHDIPLDFVYMMGRHIVIDVDNDLIFSAYHVGNSIGKALTEEYDVTEYLQTLVGYGSTFYCKKKYSCSRTSV